MRKFLCVICLLFVLVCVLAACDAARTVTKGEIVNGELVLSFSDGTTENLGKVAGADGEKGEKGDMGATGAQGVKGEKGDTGATGAQGEKGEKGDTGATGAQGEKGEKGDTGATGAQGEKGEKGEDAVDDNPQGLDFFLLPDDTYAVSAGHAIYLKEITIPATYRGKPVTYVGLPEAMEDVDGEISTIFDLNEIPGLFGFNSAPYLTKVILPDSITDIGERAFASCEKLTDIEIPNSVTSIGNGAFTGCTMLTNVSFAQDSQLTSIGHLTFLDCSGLASIDIPSGVTDIGYGAFKGCSTLTSIEIPAGVTSIDGAFVGCTSLTSIEIPAGVTSINEAFCGCTALESVTFAADSQLMYIGWYAFFDCWNLISIEIPASVARIDIEAFTWCGLRSATFAVIEGWSASPTWDEFNPVPISAADLADPAIAAQYLSCYSSLGGYAEYWWERTE